MFRMNSTSLMALVFLLGLAGCGSGGSGGPSVEDAKKAHAQGLEIWAKEWKAAKSEDRAGVDLNKALDKAAKDAGHESWSKLTVPIAKKLGFDEWSKVTAGFADNQSKLVEELGKWTAEEGKGSK